MLHSADVNPLPQCYDHATCRTGPNLFCELEDAPMDTNYQSGLQDPLDPHRIQK